MFRFSASPILHIAQARVHSHPRPGRAPLCAPPSSAARFPSKHAMTMSSLSCPSRGNECRRRTLRPLIAPPSPSTLARTTCLSRVERALETTEMGASMRAGTHGALRVASPRPYCTSRARSLSCASSFRRAAHSHPDRGQALRCRRRFCASSPPHRVAWLHIVITLRLVPIQPACRVRAHPRAQALLISRAGAGAATPTTHLEDASAPPPHPAAHRSSLRLAPIQPVDNAHRTSRDIIGALPWSWSLCSPTWIVHQTACVLLVEGARAASFHARHARPLLLRRRGFRADAGCRAG
ncbi:hypothetical protein B0H19DRAFT_152266 [Mycena capillaripes]|nr:hypothetical protein B0H19DRAFT_152266 [Mycena capillaripes]